MRFVLLILLVVLVVWAVRAVRRRIDVPKAPPTQPAPAVPPEEEMMLSCMHCGLHLPRGEALPGRDGVFCGEAHRTEYEKSHPPQ
jgi:uncharacterized protein